MKTRIERINRFGSYYCVQLDCGHSFKCSGPQLDEWQLYIGKAYSCGQCERTP